MRIAITIYNKNISNVFDFTRRLLLVDIHDGNETERSEVELDNQLVVQRVELLKKRGVDVLICGAISRLLADMVISSGIQVLPYVTGSVDEILQAYLNDHLIESQFAMPGCWPGARKGFGRSGGGGSHGHGRQCRGGRR